MRTWMTLGVLGVAAVGCVVDVALPGAPPQTFHANCSVTPTALAHIDGLGARAMMSDLTSLYVVASDDGNPTRQAVWQVPLRNAAPARIARGLDPIAGIAVNGETLLVTTNPAVGDGGAGGEVLAIPFLSRGEVVHLASNRQAPSALLVANGVVYWAEEGLDSSGQPFGAIMKTTLFDDAGVSFLQRMDPDQVPRQFIDLEWTLADGLDAEWLYWTTGDPARPMAGRGEVHGCTVPAPLAHVIRIDDPDAGGVGSIEGTSLSADPGSKQGVLLYAGLRGITAVPVDQNGSRATGRSFVPTGGFDGRMASPWGGPVYFVDPSGDLMSHVIDNATPSTARRLATGLDPATELAVDDGCVYWVDARAGNVMMVQR
jgi:hypothetical protein